jgi:transposase
MAYGGGDMAKPYSDDLRRRVIRYVENGHSKAEASRHYEVSYRTIERWMNRYYATGEIKAVRVGRPTGTGKIVSVQLEASVAADSDKTLKERSKEFGVSAAALCKAMRRLGISHKKNTAVRRTR